MLKNQYKTTKKTFSLKKIPLKVFIMGLDEVGRGAWAGPVVAACVSWDGKNPVKNILRDSKKMTARNREKTYNEIMNLALKGNLAFGIGIIENTVIDSVGIREANRLAMEEALRAIKKDKIKKNNGGIRLLIDGRDNYVFDIPSLPDPEYIIRGDSKIKQIMAASILAKVTRDKIMTSYEVSFSGYGFDRHKGYGTEIHQKALKKLGVSGVHRKSYKPIRLATSGKGL